MSVLGELKEHWISQMLGTDYKEFNSPLNLQGMARIRGERVDILAVISNEPKHGNFRKLIDGCKTEFREIRIVEIMEPFLARVLKRYGFKRFTEIDPRDGATITGMRWRRPHDPAL